MGSDQLDVPRYIRKNSIGEQLCCYSNILLSMDMHKQTGRKDGRPRRHPSETGNRTRGRGDDVSPHRKKGVKMDLRESARS